MKLMYKIWYLFQFHYREPSVIDNDIFLEELHHGEVFKIIYKTNNPVLGDLFVYYDSSKDEIVAYGLRD